MERTNALYSLMLRGQLSSRRSVSGSDSMWLAPDAASIVRGASGDGTCAACERRCEMGRVVSWRRSSMRATSWETLLAARTDKGNAGVDRDAWRRGMRRKGNALWTARDFIMFGTLAEEVTEIVPIPEEHNNKYDGKLSSCRRVG